VFCECGWGCLRSLALGRWETVAGRVGVAEEDIEAEFIERNLRIREEGLSREQYEEWTRVQAWLI